MACLKGHEHSCPFQLLISMEQEVEEMWNSCKVVHEFAIVRS